MLPLDKLVSRQKSFLSLLLKKKTFFIISQNKWTTKLSNISYAHNNYYLLALFAVFTITKVIRKYGAEKPSRHIPAPPQIYF